jgi:acyl-CoA reductase-like NAD-dependent aldehyde dehydrogenase
VYGDAEVGSALVGSDIPRVISFTGSVGVGISSRKVRGLKKSLWNWGGNAATYIDTSADLEYAAERCAIGAFVNSGQVCISLQRIYVDSIYDAFALKRWLKRPQNLLSVLRTMTTTFLGPLDQ